MIGINLLSWVKLAMIGAALVGIFFLVKWILKRGLFGIATDLKASPLGIPSRAIDSTISSATGREETLGGMIAEIFNPSTRAVSKIYSRPKPAPYIPPVADLPENSGTEWRSTW